MALDFGQPIRVELAPGAVVWLSEPSATEWAQGRAPKMDGNRFAEGEILRVAIDRVKSHFLRAEGVTLRGEPVTSEIVHSLPAWAILRCAAALTQSITGPDETELGKSEPTAG